VTAAAPTPYAKARALQDYLRNNFTYDLRVPAGHGDDALQRFLFLTKRGYCEQFAGAYAAMARAINLPSRVAVGFTPGQQGGNGTYRVLNRHAHAWPEVYLSGYGWVAFEPTPSRGAPDDQSYTGVPPMAPEGQTAAAPAADTPATPSTVAGQPTPTTVPKDAQANPQQKPHHRPAWVMPLLVLGVIAVLLGGAAGTGIARRRRAFNRRRAGATTPDARALVAWEEAEEALGLAGYPRRRAETPREYAGRVPGPAGISPGPMSTLAGATAEAAYSAGGVGSEDAAAAHQAADQVRRQLADRATRVERLRWMLGFKTKRTGPPPRIRAVETLMPGS
jgi:hypothetical protein